MHLGALRWYISYCVTLVYIFYSIATFVVSFPCLC